MPLTPAEIARTLATGRLAGTVRVADKPDGLQTVHAVDGRGDILILASHGSELGQALRDADDLGAVLAIEDVPPFDDSPHLGTVWIAGWVSRLTGSAAREAALEFASVNPVDRLLDVGVSADVFRIETAEVRLTDDDGTDEIEAEAFAAAAPDPFHADEHSLLLDLRDHHRADIAAAAEMPEAHLKAVRLDKYGLIVRVNDTDLARLEFPYAASGPCCIARILGFGHRALS